MSEELITRAGTRVTSGTTRLRREAGTGAMEAQGTAAGQAGWTLVDQGSGPSARSLHSAAAADGRLWIFGGKKRVGDWCISRWWKFPGSLKWPPQAFCSSCWAGIQFSTALVLGDLWYFEGEAAHAQRMFLHATAVQAWTQATQAGSMPSPRFSHYSAMAPPNRLWVFGGTFAVKPKSQSRWHSTTQRHSIAAQRSAAAQEATQVMP